MTTKRFADSLSLRSSPLLRLGILCSHSVVVCACGESRADGALQIISEQFYLLGYLLFIVPLYLYKYYFVIYLDFLVAVMSGVGWDPQKISKEIGDSRFKIYF